MNFLEAVKSNRSYRRTDWHYWIQYVEELDGYATGYNNELVKLSHDDIMAEDWEIEEVEIKLTRSKFLDAYMQAMTEPRGYSYTAGQVIESMLKILGFI